MRKQLTRRLACICLGVTIAGAAFAIPARAAEVDPADFLRKLASDAIATLSDEGLNQAGRAHAFRQLLRQGFDFPAVSKFVLGRHWRRANAAEREEFVQLFEDYIVATYSRRLGSSSHAALAIVGQRSDGADGALVQSQISREKGPVILLDWRLRRRADGWRVVDIMVEGVSLALAQRSEFSSVIRTSGGKVSGLLVKLRQKTQSIAPQQVGIATGTQIVSAQ